MDSSQLACDEELEDELVHPLERSDFNAAHHMKAEEFKNDIQEFSDMVKPDFRASIPGYPAPARKGMKMPRIEYESSDDEDQPDLGKNFTTDKATYYGTPR